MHEKTAGLVKNGITLLSAVDPVRRCERAADAVPVMERTLYFCPSPLYGYGLEKLLARLEKEAQGSAVLCVELDEELYELSINHIENIDNRFTQNNSFRLTNICEPEKLCAFVREQWGARAFRRVETVRLTGGFQLFPGLYNSLCEALRGDIATDWSNALTLTKLGRLYIRNALRNLSLLSRIPSIEELSFGNSDVIVMGAGPSLDDRLGELEKKYTNNELRDSEKRPFKIICVDTCLGPLKDRGITPDLVVILESQHWNLRDFIGCNGWNIPYAIDLSALPATTQLLTGQGYIFTTPWTELRLFERLKNARLLPVVIPPLGSVGLTAVEIAHRLTSGIISFAGLDFSVTIDKSHARGTPVHRHKLNTHNRFGGLLNIGAFKNNPVMKMYRELFEREFGKSGTETQGTRNAQKKQRTQKILDEFIKSEIERLDELRNILTGQMTGQGRLLVLLEECDYLWAHFPDYAGGRQADCADVSFLNRVRIEIDSMIKLLERVEC